MRGAGSTRGWGVAGRGFVHSGYRVRGSRSFGVEERGTRERRRGSEKGALLSGALHPAFSVHSTTRSLATPTLIPLPATPDPNEPCTPHGPGPAQSIILGVIWLQGGISFLFWIAYGVVQNRRSGSVRAWALSVPRRRRTLIAVIWMFLSIALIFAVLTLCLHLNGFSNNGMTPIVWVVVTVFGVIFVHGQTMATALLVATAQESVTVARTESSRIQSSQKIDHHEAPSS